MSSVLLRRRTDRAAVLAGLAGVSAVAWALTIRLVTDMGAPSGAMDMGSPMSPPGTGFVVVFAMWAAMMVGMMVPSATPMVVAYTDWTRRGGPPLGSRAGAVVAFGSGYVLVWSAFSLLASVSQLRLERAGVLTSMGTVGRPAVGGAVLVAAGLFQLTPWKESCLGRCRTPVGFLISEWREGARGGLVMGLKHGAYCLGCCWALMAVLFVVGTMNLVWMAVIAGAVLAEKTAPRVLRVRYALAAGLVGSGSWILLSQVI